MRIYHETSHFRSPYENVPFSALGAMHMYGDISKYRAPLKYSSMCGWEDNVTRHVVEQDGMYVAMPASVATFLGNRRSWLVSKAADPEPGVREVMVWQSQTVAQAPTAGTLDEWLSQNEGAAILVDIETFVDGAEGTSEIEGFSVFASTNDAFTRRNVSVDLGHGGNVIVSGGTAAKASMLVPILLVAGVAGAVLFFAIRR